jgi:hypothetical protein
LNARHPASPVTPFALSYCLDTDFACPVPCLPAFPPLSSRHFLPIITHSPPGRRWCAQSRPSRRPTVGRPRARAGAADCALRCASSPRVQPWRAALLDVSRLCVYLFGVMRVRSAAGEVFWVGFMFIASSALARGWCVSSVLHRAFHDAPFDGVLELQSDQQLVLETCSHRCSRVVVAPALVPDTPSVCRARRKPCLE